jgi:hypothetical protein
VELAPRLDAAAAAGLQAARSFETEADGRGHTLSFPQVGRFRVDSTGEVIVYEPIADASEAAARHLLFDHILPRVLYLRGALVLHASAIRAPDGRAVGFLGPSGAGKSTLAASFVAEGWSLLTDDALVIVKRDEKPVAIPTYQGLRLWPDVASRLAARAVGGIDASVKVRIDASALGDGASFLSSPAPLTRIYLVDPEVRPRSPLLERVSAGEALRIAFESELRLTAANRPSLQAALDRLAGSGVLSRCRRLAYPRDLDALPALRALIHEDLQDG